MLYSDTVSLSVCVCLSKFCMLSAAYCSLKKLRMGGHWDLMDNGVHHKLHRYAVASVTCCLEVS